MSTRGEGDMRQWFKDRKLPAATVCVICNQPIGDHNWSSWGGPNTGGTSGHAKEYAHSTCSGRPDTREPKACVTCGHVRVVRVRHGWNGGPELTATYNQHCAACGAQGRANFYAREALRWQAKARELRDRQARGKARKAR